ncbi:hypothetical protein Tco_0307207 [Tanacetum coccineum]
MNANNSIKYAPALQRGHLLLNWEKCVLGSKKELCLELKLELSLGQIDADHLSRIKNDETSDDSEVDDNFPGETLMEINTKDEPLFADFANYLAGDILPKGMTYQ